MGLLQFPNSSSNVLWEMKNLADQNQAIDMTIGGSDFNIPEDLTELASSYIKRGYNNFAPPGGLLSLRKQISNLTKKHHGADYDPETEVTVTSGNLHTISSIINSFIKEDDEVVIIEPVQTAYSPAIKMTGGKPVYVTLKHPDFNIDWEEVKKVINTKTRMIILNSPHNPTGKVFSKEDLLQLQKLTNGTNIIILSDEHYEHLVFDNNEHQSIAKFENLVSRSFIVSSFGPVFNINGWCLSWCLAPEHLMAEFRKTQMFQSFSANSPLQYALSEYLDKKFNFSEISELYQGKRNYFNRLMVDSKLKITPAQGTCFQILDFSEISDLSDLDFAYNLLIKKNVATIPLSIFYKKENNTKQLRVCFAKNNDTLEQAAGKLLNLSDIF